MRSKRDLLSTGKLYVIVDHAACGKRDPAQVAADAACGGADFIQWRAKDLSPRARWEIGQRIADALKSTDAIFIVNDHPELALTLRADGVHLGQDDLPVPEVRRLVGGEMILGLSTHSLKQALDAQAQGADYIGVGPLFATPTKPSAEPVGMELLKAVSKQVKIPFVAIGGINETNLEQVKAHGGMRAAVVRAVDQAQNVQSAAKVLKEILVQ